VLDGVASHLTPRVPRTYIFVIYGED